MEDLLASIRRAIREEDQASMQVANRAPARSERQEARLPGTPAPVMSAADDIKLLRDKINSELARAEPRLQAAALAVNSPKPFTSLFRAPQPVAQPAPVRQPQAVAAPAPMPTPEPLRLRPRLPEMTDYAPVARSAPAPSPSPSREQRLLSPRLAEATASAFGRLSESRNLESGFEHMTREMLRPMLRHWLDTHLPNIVERLVREEIERVARRGR
jgi:cell pole-organizing protein PopZ